MVDQHSIRDLVRSRSNVAVLSTPEQEAKMAEVLAFYEEYGRGRDGMQLPYTATCFRAQVLDRVTPTLTDSGSAEDDDTSSPTARRPTCCSSTSASAINDPQCDRGHIRQPVTHVPTRPPARR